jgi:hypothetical protein
MIKKMYSGLQVKYPLLLSDLNESWIFSTDFRKKTQTSNFMKIRPVGRSSLMQTDGQNDLTTLMIAFSNFEKAPQKEFPPIKFGPR